MEQKFTETPSARDLSEMNQKISALKERAKTSKVEARASFDTQLKALEDQYNLVVARMNRVSHQAEAVTDEMKKGISKAWMNLKSSFDSANKHLH